MLPTQLTTALLFAAGRRTLSSFYAQRTLTFAFAIINVLITHGYNGASVVFIPVFGCFAVTQLAMMTTGASAHNNRGGGGDGSNGGGGQRERLGHLHLQLRRRRRMRKWRACRRCARVTCWSPRRA